MEGDHRRLVEKKQELDVDTIIKMAPPEERIYRHRCVEGWSIVVPWVGFSLSELIKRVKPTGKAKYVEFTTILDKTQMPGQQRNVLEWPYVEGLRMDEAMHPLALLCFGMYGEELPNQDGAPLRIVVPWKYGFKSAKAIVRIRFTDKQPLNTWNIRSQGVRLLFQRESKSGSSAVESGQGTQARGILQASHPDVQRLRPGREPLQRDGLEEELLSGLRHFSFRPSSLSLESAS